MRWLLACLLGGCQVVFPLDAGDVIPVAERCQGVGDSFSLDLIADTYVDGTDTAHGHEDALAINDTTSMLLLFAIGPDRLEDLHFKVDMIGAVSSSLCGNDCAPCPAYATGGQHVSLTRPDWDETTVTSLHRTATALWDQPGPGGVDVIPTMKEKSTSNGVTMTTIDLDGVPADPSWPAGRVSMLFSLPLAASSPTMIVPSRETSCDPAPPPHVTVTCLPRFVCGNGEVDAFAGENCDDGNRESGDGCNEFCLDETLCGNGMLDPGEVCDDGNSNESDGCTSECQR